MTAKTSWHRYRAKLRHCHRVYSSRTNTEPIKRHFVNNTSGDKLRVPPLMPKRTIRTADKRGRWDLSAHGLLHNIEVHGPRHWNRVTVEQKFDTRTHTDERKCQVHLHYETWSICMQLRCCLISKGVPSDTRRYSAVHYLRCTSSSSRVVKQLAVFRPIENFASVSVNASVFYAFYDKMRS